MRTEAGSEAYSIVDNNPGDNGMEARSLSDAIRDSMDSCPAEVEDTAFSSRRHLPKRSHAEP